jgi:hypothetical protein
MALQASFRPPGVKAGGRFVFNDRREQERFPAKWMPVRVKKTRKKKN